MTSLCSRTFYFFLSSSMINVVTIPSNVTDPSNPNPRVLKIEKYKIIEKEMKIKKENKLN